MMEDRITLSGKFNVITLALALLGLGIMAYAFFVDPQRAWADFLLNNFYFLSLGIGAGFFFSLQYITQSGWSAGFKRIPEAVMMYIPVAAIFFVLLIFGIHSLYHWSHADALADDAILVHKSTYLNTTFFYVRLLIFFALWILMALLLRKASVKEDEVGGKKYFYKSEFLSKVFIFIIAITFSLASFDWIMSIDPHWYSALFALKNFVAAFYHGSAIIILIILLLNGKGYFPFLNKSHLHDFGRYIFMLSILYGYFWFSQFMLIWYGNIPEETIYYVVRVHDGWKYLFYADIILNWAIPFFILLPVASSRSKAFIIPVIIILIVGQYIDLYLQIMPGTTHTLQIGFIEIGSFIGFGSLFTFIIGRSLAAAPLVARNHPYLKESMNHHF